ncbi:hypothetical protein GCM10029964_019870 [Kibdelosporangium lantanae]
MFQAVHTRGDRVGDGPRTVRVRGDGQAEPVGLGDGGTQVVSVELGLLLARAGGQGAAAGHDLDDVTPALGPFPDRRPDVHSGPAEVVAVSVRGGDRRPGRHQRGHPGAVTQPQREIATVTQVADGGHTRAHGRPARLGHGRDDVGVRPCGERGDRIGASVEREVDVRVDQTRQQCRARQVHDVGVLGHGRRAVDRRDGAPVEDHRRVRQERVARAVEEPRRP